MQTFSFNTDRAPVLFIADLHLDPVRPDAMEAFLAFTRGQAREAAALFILGDLFEAWIGDDARPPDEPVSPALAALAASGTDIFLMHGNRDFLLGDDFCDAAGATRLEEPAVIHVDDEPVLLEHGDALCIDDVAYQAFRAQVRDSAWQAGFLSLPIEERLRQAQAARTRSGEEMAGKAEAIMDVNSDAVSQRLRDWQVRRLIHGHTHRPAVHEFELDGRSAARIVLGDWFEQGSVLRVKEERYTLETLSFGR
ncbi:UDP-2,3-diacylglucosamine diphosphatase [Spiribacter onubensis]|uniref:UDP-2,3-diacylglucosamine hydrolase n=1 Tax=Spiribacter onubensis TaxID=3122420 RepID=A0ABV3S8E6_9GAMM